MQKKSTGNYMNGIRLQIYFLHFRRYTYTYFLIYII